MTHKTERVQPEVETLSRKLVTRLVKKHGYFTGYTNFRPKRHCLYVRTRAISARVNRNYDGFPSEELKKAYQTFVGRPVFVNHANLDETRTRGIVVGSSYKESGNDKYVELLIEIDAPSFPKVAEEIANGNLDSVSMGTDVERTICSYCANVAEEPEEFCEHVLFHKGQVLQRREGHTVESVLVYERCEGLNFFEISFVFDPADETAIVQEVVVPGAAPRMSKKAYGEIVAPPKVDTLRQQDDCPQCGDPDFDGDECQWCNYVSPPEELQDPDLDKAKQQDLRQQGEEGSPEVANKTRGARVASQARQRELAKRRLQEARRKLADESENRVADPEEAIADTPPGEPSVDSTDGERDGTQETNVENLDQDFSTREEETRPDGRDDVENLDKDELSTVVSFIDRFASRPGTDFGQSVGRGVIAYCKKANKNPNLIVVPVVRALLKNGSWDNEDRKSLLAFSRRVNASLKKKAEDEVKGNDEKKCPACGGTLVKQDDGSRVCKSCGYELPARKDVTKDESEKKESHRVRARRKQSFDELFGPPSTGPDLPPGSSDGPGVDMPGDEIGQTYTVVDQDPDGGLVLQNDADGSIMEVDVEDEMSDEGNPDNNFGGGEEGFEEPASEDTREEEPEDEREENRMSSRRRPIRRRVADDNSHYDKARKTDVQKPVLNDTDDYGQASQFDVDKFDQNGPLLTDPDNSTDHMWAPGQGKKRAGAISALRLVEAYIQHGIIKNEQKYSAVAQFEKMPAVVVNDRLRLLSSIPARQSQPERRRPVEGHSTNPRLRSVPSFGRAASVTSEASIQSDHFLAL